MAEQIMLILCVWCGCVALYLVCVLLLSCSQLILKSWTMRHFINIIMDNETFYTHVFLNIFNKLWLFFVCFCLCCASHALQLPHSRYFSYWLEDLLASSEVYVCWWRVNDPWIHNKFNRGWKWKYQCRVHSESYYKHLFPCLLCFLLLT